MSAWLESNSRRRLAGGKLIGTLQQTNDSSPEGEEWLRRQEETLVGSNYISPWRQAALLVVRQRNPMNAIKEARQIITADPTSDASRTLARLVLALESEADFPLANLYALDFKSFGLAMEILNEWRLDRYYVRKGKLLDVSYQVDIQSAH
ncbi:hypothetical protein [Variovorax sp. RB2P76]|uniref:hypothetical protein n=1 Tax=Variovorax sp. RB2P76 TaxID=3443736 RepID=UPI003F497D64